MRREEIEHLVHWWADKLTRTQLESNPALKSDYIFKTTTGQVRDIATRLIELAAAYDAADKQEKQA